MWEIMKGIMEGELFKRLLLEIFFFSVIASLIIVIPTIILWNWLMPAIFGIKAISFWQAWGLCLLIRILTFRGP